MWCIMQNDRNMHGEINYTTNVHCCSSLYAETARRVVFDALILCNETSAVTLSFYSASVVLWWTRLSVRPCVCLSVREHISRTAGPQHTFMYAVAGPISRIFCVRIACGRGSVLLRRRCAKLCISGFMDDVMFGLNGRDAERWRLTGAATAMNDVAIPGRSLYMNACFPIVYTHIFIDSVLKGSSGVCHRMRVTARYAPI